MAANCEMCGVRFDGFDGKMVMLKEDIWLSIANKKDILCDTCIESKLKRKLQSSDLALNQRTGEKIPGNIDYAKLHELKY